MASLQVLQQLDLILSAGKVVSTDGSVSVMVRASLLTYRSSTRIDAKDGNTRQRGQRTAVGKWPDHVCS
jgi:hypothetical protein